MLGQLLTFGNDAWFAAGILGTCENRIGLAAGATKVAGILVFRSESAHWKSLEKMPICLESVPGRRLVPMAPSSPLADRLGYHSRKPSPNSEERLKSKRHLSIQL